MRQIQPITAKNRCSPTQLLLAWLLHKSPGVLPIPGTSSESHLAENIAAAGAALSSADIAALASVVNLRTVSGTRYVSVAQAEIDSEEFAS